LFSQLISGQGGPNKGGLQYLKGGC